MSIGLPMIAVSGLLLLTACGNLSAQPIFHMVTEERPIEKVADIDGQHMMPQYGRPCGEYFLIKDTGDRRSLTFKIVLTEKDQMDTYKGLRKLDMKFVKVKLDDRKKVPTAKYLKLDLFVGGEDPELLIRISRRDYEAAECLHSLKN
jgi:hypothetical protein